MQGSELHERMFNFVLSFQWLTKIRSEGSGVKNSVYFWTLFHNQKKKSQNILWMYFISK